MRTIGELAKVTGLPVRTIKFYADNRKKGGSLQSDSANLIAPCAKRGKTNLFDDEALFRLLLIQILRSVDVSIDNIRELLDGDADSPQQVLNDQIEAMERKKLELDRQIKLARLYSAYLDEEGPTAENEDDLIKVMLSGFLNDYIERVTECAGVPFENLLKLEEASGGPDAGRAAEIFGQLADEHSSSRPARDLLSEANNLYEFDPDQWEAALESLFAEFTSGASPRSRNVHKLIRQLIPLHWDALNPSEDVAKLLMGILGIKGGVLPAILELMLGEGAVAFINEAMRSCFADDCDDV